MKPSVVISLVLASILLSSCSALQDVQSFTTSYQEPQSGPRARLRVVPDGMVRAVPNSTCTDWRLPGAGLMIVNKKGFASINDRTLGIPPSAYSNLARAPRYSASELYVAAGQPLTLNYMTEGQRAPGAGTAWRCAVTTSFVPVAGSDYEASFTQGGAACNISIVQRQPDSSPSVSVTTLPAGPC